MQSQTKSGKQLRLVGLETAASHNEADLRRAQDIALLLGQQGKVLTSDDVRLAFEQKHGRPLDIGNCIGNLFKNRKKWECVGSIRSKRPSSHARFLPQWRLRESYKPAPQPFEVGVENGIRFCIKCSHETDACTCPKD